MRYTPKIDDHAASVIAMATSDDPKRLIRLDPTVLAEIRARLMETTGETFQDLAERLVREWLATKTPPAESFRRGASAPDSTATTFRLDDATMTKVKIRLLRQHGTFQGLMTWLLDQWLTDTRNHR